MKGIISEGLKKSLSRRIISFGAPNKKRISDIVPEEFFEMDVSFLEMTDDLFNPKTFIKMSQTKMASVYRCQRSFYLSNGATGGILTMIALCTKPGDKIIVDRFCHRSVINAIIIMGLNPVFAEPVFMHRFGFSGGHCPKDIEEIIMHNPDAKAVLITSPTYYGVVSDIKEISKTVHQHKMYFLVDESCGAHFQFSSYLPAPAIVCGADMAVQSIHKTMGALKGGAIMHVNTNDFLSEEIEDKIYLFQTENICMPFVSSSESAIIKATKNGYRYKTLVKEIKAARKCINENTNAYWLDEDMIKTCEIFDMDITRAVINFSFESFTGYEAASMLFNNSSIKVEFSDEQNIICVFTPYTKKSEIRKLVKAILKISQKRADRETVAANINQTAQHTFLMTPQNAYFSEYETVNIDKSIGMASKNIVSKYPQGSAILVPGEIITPMHIRVINEILKDGGFIEGLRENNCIDVVKT